MAEEHSDAVRQRALDKVRKCMALASSSNPHEAETALRQARKLMDKFHLDQSDVLASQIESASFPVGKGFRLPPLWVRLLSELVASAFGCVRLVGRTRGVGSSVIFVGPIGNTDMCLYAYQVLSRQLEAGKKEFMAGLPDLSLGTKRKMGARYSEQWILSVHHKVKSFSGLDESVEKSIDAFMGKHFPDIEYAKPVRRPKLSEAEMLAAIAGSQDGREASLNVPMGSDRVDAIGSAAS